MLISSVSLGVLTQNKDFGASRALGIVMLPRFLVLSLSVRIYGIFFDFINIPPIVFCGPSMHLLYSTVARLARTYGTGHKCLCDVIKLLNSVASVLKCGEFFVWLVHIHVMFHRYCTVHCKRMIPREDTSITHMCILVTLPVSCTVLLLQHRGVTMNVIVIYCVERNKSIITQIIIHKSVKGRGTRINHL